MKKRAGFTLIEMLVVIFIILLLAGLLLPAIQKAREKGRQAHCINNLHEFSIAIAVYRHDYEDKSPPWLSTLYPKYVDKINLYVCKSDGSDGKEGSKPDDDPTGTLGSQYAETDDNKGRNGINACSYLYELSTAKCEWYEEEPGYVNGVPVDSDGNGEFSWAEVKECQLRYGDSYWPKAYPETIFPVIRCYHHYRFSDFKIQVGGSNVVQGLTLNVAYAGNWFRAPLKWELLAATGGE